MVKQISKLGKIAGNYDLTKGVNLGVIGHAIYNNGDEKKCSGDLAPGYNCDKTDGEGNVPDGTFTVADAVDGLGVGKFQIILSVFTGVCWMADSMELKTLSILPPALHCDFCITNYQQAFLTTIVFVGMMISSPFWGNLSDRFGRRKTLWISVAILATFGAISSISPGYYWLLGFRFIVGIAIGCVPQSLTLYSEFLPSQQRAKSLVFMNLFWGVGASVEVLLALIIMPTLGWKWLLGISSIPMLVYFLMCFWLPESVRYQAVSGKTDKAMATLQRISKVNKKPMPRGQLIVEDVTERGRFQDLLRPDMRLTTILLWVMWAFCAFCFYGVVFLATEIFEQNAAKNTRELLSQNNLTTPVTSGVTTELIGSGSPLPGNGTTVGQHGFVDGVCGATGKPCQVLTTEDYIGLLWITLAEFPGILITMFILDKIGRKKTMGIQFLLFAVAISAFVFNVEGRALTTVILFLARGLAAAGFIAIYVYTPEVYPTSMRSVGIGTCCGMSRIGAMITPYVAQVLSETSLPLAVTCYGVAALIIAVLSILLPIETKGKAMPD